MSIAVLTSDLTRYYPVIRSDPLKAVDGVDLELPEGSAAVISGPSGSGKTTLLALLAGLDRPNQGRVELFGQALSELSDGALAVLRRHRVGLVFQDFKLLMDVPCWENVTLALIPEGIRPADRRQRALELLEELGVGETADRPPRELSGGQQQRVALARALINDPDLVLADEPTSQVDAESGEKVLNALMRVVEKGKTLVLTTHDPRFEIGRAARYRMVQGRIEREDDP